MDNEIYKHHAGIAAVLSFLFTGLGQIYNGQIKKGLILMFFSGVGMIMLVLGAIILGGIFLAKFPLSMLFAGIFLISIGFTVICIAGVFSIGDAFKNAK